MVIKMTKQKISKKIGKMWKDTTGVSPIIAVILMVAITVVLAATIYVWVSGFGGGGGTSASVNLAQTDYDATNATNNTVNYQVLTATGGLGWEDIKINIGGKDVWTGDATTQVLSGYKVTITSGGISATDGKISAGDTIEIESANANIDTSKTTTVFDIDSDTPIWSAKITY